MTYCLPSHVDAVKVITYFDKPVYLNAVKVRNLPIFRSAVKTYASVSAVVFVLTIYTSKVFIKIKKKKTFYIYLCLFAGFYCCLVQLY